jgi:hypothetical protein
VFETLSILPLAFWAVVALLILGAVWAIRHFSDGSGLPMLTVLGTVTAWYVGDAFYNDYASRHANLFETDILQSAWWQVACFLLVFLFATPFVHRRFNARHIWRGSGVQQMYKYGVGLPVFQRQLDLLFKGSILLWAILVLIAVIRLRDQIPYYFFPFLDYKATPWGRGRLGSGFDGLLSVAEYVQQMVTGIFGVVAALTTRPRIRRLALICCLLTWPYYIFDRTRNTMLSVVIPGVLSWCLLRLRGRVLKKAAVLGACFFVINAWMAFVIANRSDMSIVEALKEKGFSLNNEEMVHHEGLNMYEELCWINTFIQQGTYSPNWGYRYFADFVNPIPRALWPGKPMIGIDYAIARGQGADDVGIGAGVYATVSTGLIGQGVVNFGRLFGPAAAALIMSLWVAVLARLDLYIQKVGRLPVYATGLFTTFNVGRDICFIALYPFFFGLLVIWWLDRSHVRADPQSTQRTRLRIPLAALKKENFGTGRGRKGQFPGKEG